jgi:hypothetical protein
MNGSELLSREITKSSTTIDISGLASGVYIVRFKNDTKMSFGKIVKQ